jgi:SAM-dependent methyltransferase/glycosyltransferase involved in cell wall biosynthesis
MEVCTIIAKNYVAFARVLASSFQAHNPQGRCWTLVIDDFEGYIDPAEEPFEVVTIDDLEIEHFDRMAALYDVLELSTAVKPWLLRHLLGARGLERITYLDPDIRIYDDLGGVDRLLGEHRMVVTPHLTEPMPRDGRKPNETDILIAGAYNLGFIGLSGGADTDHLLDWWSERLETDCVVAPEKGYFVDQRWIDFAPGLVKSFHVLRDPGYNVAYWNLPSRSVRGRGDSWEVNGSPLRFFHFSGFDPTRPDTLSKHQDRLQLKDSPAVRRLCRDYAEELVSRGYGESGEWPYTFAVMANGMELDQAMRQVYRDAIDQEALDQSVFTVKGAREFTDWLNGPAAVKAADGGAEASAPERDGMAARAGVTRYLEALHELRPDLRQEFPDLEGPDAARLVAWAEVYGRTQIPPELLPGSAATRVADLAPGVNLAGYFRSVLGVGEVARQVVDALEGEGVPVAPVGLVASHSPQDEKFRDAGPPRAPYPINLICVNADALPSFARDVGQAFFTGRYSIGLWWWEVSRFPERWADSFDHLDEVWVGTSHVADAVTPLSPVPVTKIKLPVSVPRFERRSRATLGLPEGFLFMFVFDYMSVFERKNPLALIEAFEAAFPEGAGASLVIKCMNHERDPAKHERLLAAAARHPGVHVIDRHLSRADKDAMIDACDCYASLHRAEGFGIPLAEAMWLGKPVIATAYSGNLDYMTPENSYLVDHRLVPIGEGAEPYPADGEWAEPDTEQAAELMRGVVEDREDAARRAARGQAEIHEAHSPQAAGRAMARRLLRIQAWSGPRRRGPLGPRTVDTTRVAERIRSGPAGGAPSRIARLRRVARTAMLRVIKPFSVHQRAVDTELLHAIQALDNGLQALARSHAQADRLIAETRAVPYMAGARFELVEHPVAGIVSGFSESGAGRKKPGTVPADVYGRFEDIFRGPESFIRDRLRSYLELLGDREPVLDVGCGRGEFLDLLRERGLDYTGVDVDPKMVERCRERGHERVHRGDANSHLESLDDGSLGVVFSAQVVEHMSYDQLVRFLELSLRKLQPGGLLIAETVNPHSMSALKTFWVDPTHEHPLFPEVAMALCRITGFESGFVFHPNGSGNVEADRYYEGEYAVVATRGSSPRELRSRPRLSSATA